MAIDKRAQAIWKEIGEFRERKERIKRELDGMIADNAASDELAAKVREWTLAIADHVEVQHGKHEAAMIRVHRLRANSPVYCSAYVTFLMAERLLKEVREAFDRTPAERKADDDRHMSEAESLRRGIEAMLTGLRGPRG